MTLLVDTSVWSLALRRDTVPATPEVRALRDALLGAAQVVTTGLILQELLQGFSRPKARIELIQAFASLAFLQPDRQDHIDAAEVRNACRRRGVQLGTVDALLVQLCIRHELTMLTTDHDFGSAARHVKLSLWRSG